MSRSSESRVDDIGLGVDGDGAGADAIEVDAVVVGDEASKLLSMLNVYPLPKANRLRDLFYINHCYVELASKHESIPSTTRSDIWMMFGEGALDLEHLPSVHPSLSSVLFRLRSCYTQKSRTLTGLWSAVKRIAEQVRLSAVDGERQRRAAKPVKLRWTEPSRTSKSKKLHPDSRRKNNRHKKASTYGILQ